MPDFPCSIEAGNAGDGQPLTLNDPEQLADLWVYCSGSGYLLVTIMDWDGDGDNELIGSSADVFTFKPTGSLPDGTPIVDRGLRWGATTRAPQRDDTPEADSGLCGSVLAKGNFGGDGRFGALVGPHSIGTGPLMVISPRNGVPSHRSQGVPIKFMGTELKPRHQKFAALDWDGDGCDDLIAIFGEESNYEPIDPSTGGAYEDIHDRYTLDGRWKG